MTIRSAAPSDAKDLLEIYAYYVENTAISFEYKVPSPEEFRKRIETTLKKYPYIVLDGGNGIIGYAYAGIFKERDAYSRSCEVSIYVKNGFTHKGFGRMLYAELEKALFSQGILNLYACIAYPEKEDEYLTLNSVQFHSHLGYVKAGEFHKCAYKFGRWYNMIWMEKIIGIHGQND